MKEYLDKEGFDAFVDKVKNKFNSLSSELGTPISNQTDTTVTIEPNIYYVWGEVEELNIELGEPTNDNILNEYMIEFISGDTPTVLNLPESVQFGTSVVINPNTRYQVSILNNIGIIAGV